MAICVVYLNSKFQAFLLIKSRYIRNLKRKTKKPVARDHWLAVAVTSHATQALVFTSLCCCESQITSLYSHDKSANQFMLRDNICSLMDALRTCSVLKGMKKNLFSRESTSSRVPASCVETLDHVINSTAAR